jgi:hypothetical protein
MPGPFENDIIATKHEKRGPNLSDAFKDLILEIYFLDKVDGREAQVQSRVCWFKPFRARVQDSDRQGFSAEPEKGGKISFQLKRPILAETKHRD